MAIGKGKQHQIGSRRGRWIQCWILKSCYDPGISSERVFLGNTNFESILSQRDAEAVHSKGGTPVNTGNEYDSLRLHMLLTWKCLASANVREHQARLQKSGDRNMDFPHREEKQPISAKMSSFFPLLPTSANFTLAFSSFILQLPVLVLNIQSMSCSFGLLFCVLP